MSDTLEIQVVPDNPPRTLHEWALREVLARVHDDSEFSLAMRARALEVLQTGSADTIAAFDLAREYLVPGDVLGEWAIMWVAGQCSGKDLLQWLHDQAIREVPLDHDETGCERESDGHVIVRVMATEAVLTVVADVDAGTRVEILLSIIAHQPHTAVRAAAASALYDLDDSLRERVASLLDESQRWIAEVRKLDYTEVVADPTDRGEPIRVVGRPPRESPDRASYAVPRADCCGCPGRTDRTDTH